jgi:sarcosine oxidase subunit gamma
VADDLLRRRSALAAGYREARPDASPGVVLSERRLAGLAELLAWAPLERLGPLALPGPNRARRSGDAVALNIAPQRWLLVGALPEAPPASVAALVDQGHARTVIRVAGPRARDLLAQGTGVDLASFASDHVAATTLGHVAVVLHAVADDAIEVYVPRSLALALWEWMIAAAAPLGCAVEPRG